MKVVLQRVKNASVSIDGQIKASIGHGLLILVGFHAEDQAKTVQKMAQKIACLRIFSDAQDKMNLSIQDIQGEILVVSQFTLYADTQKGNRPSFIQAAKPEIAIPHYELFIQSMQSFVSKPLQTGIFGADMQVSLCNDGPVTIILEA